MSVYTFDVSGIIWRYTLDASNNATVGNGTTDSGNATTLGTDLSGVKIIPSALSGYTVTSIDLYAFYNCTVSSVTIPNSVTSIRSAAFFNCTGLTSVTIPNSVTSISDNVFTFCYQLSSVMIPDSVTSIRESTFSGCSGLTSVTIGNSVTSIGESAFNSCNSLTSVTIPDSVTSIGIEAFRSCGSLTSINIPDSVTSIGNNAFTSTHANLTVTMNTKTFGGTTYNSPTIYGDIAFFGNTNVTLVLPPQPPTMTITATASGSPLASGSTTKNTPIVLTFTSSASTADFGEDDISLTNGSLNSSFAASSGTDGKVYTATFTPNGQGPVVCTINVSANKFTAAGVNNIASDTFTFIFDAAPTMTITSTTLANGSTTNVKPIELTFTSSEAIFDFIKEDISFNNGTLSDITVSSATVYTATFTPTIQGAYTINVPVGAFADASGNTNAVASTFTFNFDAAPTMTITSTTLASGATSNIASIPLTFTASETITDFAVEDISFNKGSLTAFASSSATVYTATFTQGGQGEHIINVPVGVYIDASGNANTAASTFTWSYDSVQPTMDISSTTLGVTSGSTTNNSTIALTFTSSKPTNNFIKEDISFNRGSLAGFDGSGTVYTATFTPNGQGAHTIYVPVDAYADSAGNNNTVSNTFAWSYDSISPTMDISSTTVGVTRGSTTKTTPIELRFTSTEATTNFALEDISFNNGTLTNFVRISDTVYTARFAPTSPGPVACTIDVLAGAYTDAATNLNNLATQFAFTFDSVVPTMTITSTAGVVSGSTIDNPTIALTFTSSKATTNFAVGDISVTNGTLSAFASSSPTVYTATFTPTRQGLCTIGVASSVYTDAASNNNTAATTFSFGYIPKFAEFNNANNLEQTYIAGFLDVSGELNHRSGDLTVMAGNVVVHAGNANFNSGNLYVGGNVSVNSNMAVVGTTKLTSLVARDNLDVSGASTLGGSLTVAGITSLNNHVSIANNKQFTVGTGKALFGGDVSLNSNLIVDNDASLKSSVDVIGSAVFANTAVNGALLFNTRPSFASDISLNAPNIDIYGILNAQYAANSIPASAFIGGAGNVIEADVSMNAGLNVVGATTLSAVTTSGGATIGGTLNIIGASTMPTLSISNATTIGGPLNVMGKTAFSNDVSFNGSRIDICGNFYANYPANSIPSSAIMGGGSSTYNTDVSLNAGLFVSNAVTLGSTLVVSGKTALRGDISLGNVNGSRIDICGNLYANYAANSIPQSAIIGGAGSSFATDVSMNAGLYVKDGITLDTITMQYQQTPDVGLYVNAALNATTLSSSGNATINNTLTVTSTTTLSSTLNVTGAATLGSLTVSGATTTGTLTTTGAATINSTLNVSGISTFNAAVTGRSTLAVVGATTLKSTLTVVGATTMNSGLSVVGATTMKTTLSVVGATTLLARTDVSGTLIVSGATTLGSTLAVSGATTLASVLTVVGTTRFKGDISMNSTLNVLGDVSLNSTLNVSGATTLPALTVVGVTTVGSLRVNQTAPFALDVVMGNKLTVARDVSMNARLLVGGSTTIRGTLTVAGASTLAALTTTGNTIIGDNLTVYNTAAFAQDASLNVTNVDISGVVNAGQIKIGAAMLQYRPNIFQLGGDIDGEIADDRSGISVSLSADGSILAIGATQNDGTTGTPADVRGHVRVYQRNVTNTTIAPIGWTQLGGDIDGEAASDGSGQSVEVVRDLSSNIIVAIGAILNDGTTANGGDNRGHVRVYQYEENKVANTNQGSDQFGPLGWKRLGADIDGEVTLDQSGYSLSLAVDPSSNIIVAIGSNNNDGTTTSPTDNRGKVRVYQYVQGKAADTNQSNPTFGPLGWKRLGADIDGEVALDESGWSVALSGDGSTVAIGGYKNDGTSTSTTDNRGHVRVYKYGLVQANAWSQLGSDIDGEAASDQSGISVSLSADGTIVAIGANKNDGTTTNTGDDRGHVRVFKYGLVQANAWSQLGGDIDGEVTLGESGFSVFLAGDGYTVAIGAQLNDGTVTSTTDNRGHVRIYKYDPLKTSAVTNESLSNFGPVGWTRLGVDIDGELPNDQSGFSVSLSADGSTVAIGAFFNDGTNPGVTTDNRGHVRVYQLLPSAGLLIDASLNTPSIVTTGFASVGGVLSVAGATTMSRTLFVTGASTFVTLSSIGGATIGGTLNVNGATTVGSTLRVNGAATASSLTTNSNTTVGGVLNVADATTMGALNYTGQLLQW